MKTEMSRTKSLTRLLHKYLAIYTERTFFIWVFISIHFQDTV